MAAAVIGENGKMKKIEFDVEKTREDFPFLEKKAGAKGRPLVYFDNAATTQKPRQVLQAIENYYAFENANPHRGVYKLSEKATSEYENARMAVKKFLNAGSEWEAIFTRNATEALNLIKHSHASEFLKRGDRMLATEMEHHANLVPWIQLSKEKRVGLDYVRVTPEGVLEENWVEKITGKTGLLCITHASNVLGTINDVKEMCEIARSKNPGITIVVDGAQAAPHFKIDLDDIDCDFYVLSGHKMLAPMGAGVLLAKKKLLERMPPFLVGGDMIRKVGFHDAEWNEIPWKFEAGTPDVGAAVGLAAAIEYLRGVGMDAVRNHEEKLTRKLLEVLQEFGKIKVFGPHDARERVGAVAFSHSKIHAHDLATALDDYGIAIRSGHHCAMPLHAKLGVPATARASVYVYNTIEEVEFFAQALAKAEAFFGVKH